jgi:hypothetical protein
MDLSNPELEEIKAYYKKKEEEHKREYDEFVEQLEQETERRWKECEEEYSKYIDDEEVWEKYLNENERRYEEDVQEGKYIFIF